jgi:hypothetical protein
VSSSINPAMLLQMLKARSMGGGAAAGATGTGATEEAVGPAARQLQGADPAYSLKLVMKIKQDIANLIPALAFRAPAAARALSASFKSLDSAIKELQQAQATMQAIGGPVGLSAVPQPQPAGGSSMPQPVAASGQGM